MPHDVAEGRRPEAGAELLGDGGAADDVAPFENEGLEAGLGQIGTAHEPVVTAANDDSVVLCRQRFASRLTDFGAAPTPLRVA